MILKNSGSQRFTDLELRQLASIDSTARKLDHDAHTELRRIGELDLTPRQCRQAGEALATVATRLTFALRYRQEILTAGRRRPYDKIVVRMGTLCDCPDNQPLPTDDDENETADEELDQNMENRAEIKSLLELATQIEERMWTRSTLRGAPLSIFFRHLNRLKLALLKQKKDLEDRIRTPQTQIEVVYDRHKCGGKSLEIDGSDE
jgi:hypothetical protein